MICIMLMNKVQSIICFNPLAAEEFFSRFFFENLIKNTYYWLDQEKKVKNAKKNLNVFLGILRVALLSHHSCCRAGIQNFS